MIVIRNLKLNIGYTEDDIREMVTKKLRTSDFKSIKILKESLDSRKHDDIHYNLTVGVYSENEKKIFDKLISKNNSNKTKKNNQNQNQNKSSNTGLVNNKKVMLTDISLVKEEAYIFPHIINNEIREFLDEAPEYRPVIIGSGPAGYMAAIQLARAGFKPIVIERGNPVEERISDVETFWEEGVLNPESNVCFGEGGAGTFSDGKLNTGNKDKGGYFKEVLETFVRYGADKSVSYKAKPHIGTDELRKILKNMRQEIIKFGGEVRFGHKLVDIEYETTLDTFGYESELPIYELKIEILDYDNKSNLISSNISTNKSNNISKNYLNNKLNNNLNNIEKIYYIKTHSLILAIGHSARDTYQMLNSRLFVMEPKPFAIGVRVEHKSDDINKAMYGKNYKEIYGDKLPAADYKLVYHTQNTEKSRNVFSFCMCPGGYVVNSSSEDGALVINGMSYSGRAGENSNAAIVVSIDPDDYITNNDSNAYLQGIDYQRKLEQAAYEVGSGKVPVQLYGDFIKDTISNKLGKVSPEIKGKWTFADLRKVLPDFMTDAIIEAMEYFGTKIDGYDSKETVISAIESRTSSPVRINRDKDTLMADNFPGIVPAGEGAGYAGGITSASADGIKAAEAISEYLIEDLIESYKRYETAKYL